MILEPRSSFSGSKIELFGALDKTRIQQKGAGRIMGEPGGITPNGWGRGLAQMAQTARPFRFREVSAKPFGAAMLLYRTSVSPKGYFPLCLQEGIVNHGQIGNGALRQALGITLLYAPELAGKEVYIMVGWHEGRLSAVLLIESRTLRPLAVFREEEGTLAKHFFNGSAEYYSELSETSDEVSFVNDWVGGQVYCRVRFYLEGVDVEAYLRLLGCDGEIAKGWTESGTEFYFQIEITPEGSIIAFQLKTDPGGFDLFAFPGLQDVFAFAPDQASSPPELESLVSVPPGPEAVGYRSIPDTLDLSRVETAQAADANEQQDLITLLCAEAHAAAFDLWRGLSPDAQREILSGLDMELLWSWFVSFWQGRPKEQVIAFIKSLEVIPALELLYRAVEVDKTCAKVLIGDVAQDQETVQTWGSFIEGQSFSVNQFLVLAALYPAGDESGLKLGELLRQRNFTRFENRRITRDCAAKFPNLARLLQEEKAST